MKKKPPPKVVKLTVHDGGKDKAPWNSTVEGVLRRALEEHQKRGYSDIVIVGLRLQGPDTFTFS